MPVETKISFSDGSSTDTLRKLSGDYSRKHLSDLVEAEEDGEVSSLPSDTSRPHRKASNHSVVLTEDTDSFIIGDRVWVGGTKPGQIAYIGETQFAPGEWAGIVLDDAIGKNDGSVAGVRYFQCAEKRGVFSRLTRLTRSPIIRHDSSPISDAGSVFDRPPSGTPRPRRNLSPNGSIRSAISSKMNASVTTSGTNGELRLGERVIVSSSRGSKAGTLRYVGGTEFASGVWAGVELDDPLGKNDGSVEGKRYFDCSPRFGLFAPISKVSRSPSNRKPGACAIHSNGRATPLRRSNSRESFTSLGSSIASSRVPQRISSVGGAQRMVAPRASSTPVSAKNALQELLREKQKHLERLLMERDLERADVADVTIRAERAENVLEQVKKDATAAIKENEKLKMELDKLNKVLEDEKQKVEDLMFSNEEENINKEDYNKYREEMEKQKIAMEQRIRELEAEASLQSSRAEAASNTTKALDEQRAIEIASLNEQHKEEVTAAQTLSTELQKLLDEAYVLLQEKESEKDSIGKSMSEELSKLKMESEKALNEAKTKMAISQTEFETQVSVLTAKLQLAESKLENERQNTEKLNKDSSQTVIDLNVKLSQLQAALDDKTYELNKVLGTSKEHEVNLNKEITKLKMELSAKVNDYEQLMEDNSKQETKQKALEKDITNFKQELETKINEYETLLNEASQQNENSKIEIMKLQQNLATKSKEYEKLLADSGSANVNTEKLINEYKQTIHERDKEIIKLKNEYEQANANFNIQQSKIAEEYKKDIDERNMKIDQLIKEINAQKLTLESSKVEFDTLNSQYNVNVDEIKALRQQNEDLRKSVNELTQINGDLKNKVAEMELEVGELKRQLASSNERYTELQKSKQKIENEYLNLTGQATDSNDQFNKLNQHLKETEKELQELKEKLRENTNTFGRNEQELKQQIFKIQDEYSLERSQLLKTIDENAEKQKQHETKINEYDAKMATLKNQLKEVETNKDKTSDENVILKQEIVALQNKETELNDEYQKTLKQMQDEIYKYKNEISLLKEVGETSEVKLKEKVDQLIEAQNELNNKLEESHKHEDALQKVVNDTKLQLNNQKLHFEKEISQYVANISQAREEINVYKSQEVQLKELLHEKENNIKELTLKIGMSDVDLKSNLDIIVEKERQLQNINSELTKANENKKLLEEKLNETMVALTDLRQKYDAIASNSSAEGSLLKEQQLEVETLKKDLTVLSQERQSLESAHNIVNDELHKLKEEYNEMIKKLEENVEANTKLKNILGEKEAAIKNNNETHETDLNKLKQLEQALSQVKQDLTCKNNYIQEKDQQIHQFNEMLKSSTSETQGQLKSLQEENVALNNKYKSEIETLTKTISTLQTQVQQQQSNSDELDLSKTKVTELQSLLEKSENDIKQLRSINDGQKSNYEELNKLIKGEFDEYKKKAKQYKSELKTKLSEYENELKDSKYKYSEEVAKQIELQQKLQESEKNIIELSNKLELVNVQKNANVQKDDKLERLTLELQATRKTNSEMITNNEAIIKKMKYEIENKAKSLKEKEETILGLRDKLNNQKAKIEISEREKLLLQKELSSRSKESLIKDNNDNGLSLKENTQKLEEEREVVEGQVNFLNSVIVDMQRKNEQLTARVRALEGGTPEAAPTCNGRIPKAVAPRLFCDICDVFDAHDTEDCPRQSAMDEPEPPTQRKPPPPPRPYCDICEVFGHATENCDEEETF